HSGADERTMFDERFREGFAVLGEMGLTFDAWCYHSQLADFVDLAASFPNVTIVLDHFGGPLGIGPYEGKHEEVFAVWREQIAALKGLDNVYFKLGGINMTLNGYDWHKREMPPTSDELLQATSPYYEYCIEQFGPRRCMFESNFPVDKASCSYHVLWNAFKKMTRGMDPVDRAALFHDTAVQVYRLAA
ncbi:MAG: amidohydrolase family protein, partial [Pseudohongiellaceae bacterium]